MARPTNDFVLTINSDDEDASTLDIEEEDETDDEIQDAPTSAKKRKREADTDLAAAAADAKAKKRKNAPRKLKADYNLTNEDGVMDPNFEFQLEQDLGLEEFDAWDNDGGREAIKRKKGVDMDELIARRSSKQVKPAASIGDDNSGSEVEELGDVQLESDSEDDVEFGMDARLSENESDTEIRSDIGAADEEGDESDVADEIDVDHLDEASSSDTGESQQVDDEEERAKSEAFFAPEGDSGVQSSGSGTDFQSMHLSRPILRGLTAAGFLRPTPIQAKTIPIALLGKDVVGGAVTGSGKTGAFMIPILDRLVYRNKKIPTSRVAILMPTRELAVQCFNVATKLAAFTDITFCQLVGGFSLREQENILKKRPDVIIATPGRFIDHMRNSPSFTIDTLEILVLDEADRMLEEGFADELNEILATIPKSRQTMLFSATMTNSVDKLIGVGLNKPVRLMVDAKKQTVGTLTQEFVRLRAGREEKRLAYLLQLCSTVYEQRCIIFFRQKKEAHRVRIVFGLCGWKVAELHGSMSQEQRIQSVESFRAGKVSHLLATDVASRGLDIKGVEAVINYEAPQSHEIYLHRVGRTARAGRYGRACTIAAETDRKVVRAAVTSGKKQGARIVSRQVDPSLADEWARKINGLAQSVEDLLKDEKEEKHLQSMEMQIRKGENMIAHEKEIMARPKRDWFQTEKEKLAAKQAGALELNGVAMKKVKLSNKAKKKLDAKKERKEGRTFKKGKSERGVRNARPSKGKKKR